MRFNASVVKAAAAGALGFVCATSSSYVLGARRRPWKKRASDRAIDGDEAPKLLPPSSSHSAFVDDPLNAGLSSEDISLSISLPSGGGDERDRESGDDEEDDDASSGGDKARLAQIRTGIFRILSEDQVDVGNDTDSIAGGVGAGEAASSSSG